MPRTAFALAPSWSKPGLTLRGIQPPPPCLLPPTLPPKKKSQKQKLWSQMSQLWPDGSRQRSALILDLRPGFWFQPAVARNYQPFKCVQNPVTSPHTGELLKLFPQSKMS